MSGSTRRGGTLLLALLAGTAAHAEGVGSKTRASTGDRLYAAQTLTSVPGGLISIGGPALRRLPTGARRWETLHVVDGDNLYRVAHDDAGRLLAAWEKEPLIHFFAPAQNQHVTFPKPVAPPGVERGYQVDSLELLPSGREALVYMAGTVQVTTGRFHGPSWSTTAYRIALDGKSPARLAFRLDHGYRLHTSRFGAVFAMPRDPGNKCDFGGCDIVSIVAYEISDAGASPRTLLGGPELSLGRARLVRGSDAQRVVLLLDVSRPKGSQLLRWRYGQARADVRSLPFSSGDDRTSWLVSKSDELIELRGLQGGLEVWRHGSKGDQRLASLRAIRNVDTGIHGFGERPSGDLWVHYGDHLGLIAPGLPPLAYDLQALLPPKSDWGGDMYIKDPEQLWVGIDGLGRDFARVSFGEAESRAKPWPAGINPTVTGGESAGHWSAKDPSTSKRLYSAVTLRPMTGGLFSIGGPALRRLPDGAAKWETLFVVEKDSLYRATSDASGRLLAAWEKDPFIHFLAPAQGVHVALPKPPSPPSVKHGFQVDDLYFAANGRDALVYMTGRLDSGLRQKTAAYWIALDGQSAPRLAFEVDDAYAAVTSRAGAVLVMPERPGQECTHRTCFPISAVVAYELSDRGATPRTLLTVDQADVSGTWPVNGSGDQGIALVFELTRRNGPQRLNGGRGLLRWRWGDARADYRRIPGITDLTPQWLVTGSLDFIEVQHRYQDQDQLELHSYPMGTGEPTVTTLRNLEHQGNPYGIGERGGGRLWVHWGDNLALLSPGKPPRSVNIGSILGRGFEWAGSHTYVKTPESLWVGLDGNGRNYSRLDFAEMEKRAQLWR